VSGWVVGGLTQNKIVIGGLKYIGAPARKEEIIQNNTRRKPPSYISEGKSILGIIN